MASCLRTILHTSSALAVVLSALTNISGFGNLSISPHCGMASMGVMLSIGIPATLICSFIVLPALLKQLEHLSRRFNRQNRTPLKIGGDFKP